MGFIPLPALLPFFSLSVQLFHILRWFFIGPVAEAGMVNPTIRRVRYRELLEGYRRISSVFCVTVGYLCR